MAKKEVNLYLTVQKSDYCVMIPYFGGIDFVHNQCVRELDKRGVQLLKYPGCPYIDMARGKLVETALASFKTARYFMFIDHDILFEPDDVERLIETIDESHYDILGVPYSKKRPLAGIVGHIEEDWTAFDTGGIYPAKFLGMGFTVIRRTLLETIREFTGVAFCPSVDGEISPMFSHLTSVVNQLPDDTTRIEYWGEDVSFCWRAKKCGAKIGVWTVPRIFHRGGYDYSLEDVGKCVPNHASLTIQASDNPSPKLV